MATAERVESLLVRRGASVLGRDAAIAAIEEGVSSSFVGVTRATAVDLARVSSETLDDVAFGRNTHALAIGSAFLDDMGDSAVGLGRTDELARDAANLCLYLVRAHMQLGAVQAAVQQVEQCFRAQPDLVPDESLHPPDVVALVSVTRRRMEAGAGGVLWVEGAPTDPRGCVIRANGRPVGSTPWQRLALFPGRYGVQVECRDGAPGRVHHVDVRRGGVTRSLVSARHDEVLRTVGRVGLAYASPTVLRGRLAADVAQLGTSLHVTRVAVVVGDGGPVRLLSFRVSTPELAELVGSGALSESSDSNLEAVVHRVLDGRVAHGDTEALGNPDVDESGVTAAEAAPVGAPPSAAATARLGGARDADLLPVSVVLIGSGAALLAASTSDQKSIPDHSRGVRIHESSV